MTAEQLLKTGQLDEAIDKLNVEVRDEPTNSQRRTFLFELLCFAGDYSRAKKHLEVLAQSGPQAELGALLYKGALTAEQTRQEMFEKQTYPGPVMKSVGAIVNGKACDSFSDADPRIGSSLELIVAGTYTWLPFDMIETIQTAPPRRVRDLLWLPAAIQTKKAYENRELSSVLIPVLYPGSWKSNDPNVRLGRATIWIEKECVGAIPLGQKMLLADEAEWPLLDIREVKTQAAAATAP